MLEIISQSGFHRLLVYLSGFLFLFSSCLPEQKLGKSFVKSSNMIHLTVSAPDLVFKYNHKGELVDDFDSLSEPQQDSALWASSRYIQHLSDSILLESYVNNFVTELRELGFNVFLQAPDDSLINARPQFYNLAIAQLQVDEYLYPLEDEQEIEGTVYYKRFRLNAADFSAWFELSKAGGKSSRKTVLYSTASIYDSFEGKFLTDPFSPEVRYTYTIDTLRLNDIYNMGAHLGKRHAGYLFDYFMNQFIDYNMPQGMVPLYYFHYNRRNQSVQPAVEDEMLQVIKN